MSWQEESRILRDCEEAFEAADNDRKGYLTAEDYKVAILSLFGYKPSKYEVDTVWRDKRGASDGSQAGLTKEQFVSLAAERIIRRDKEAVTREVFTAFDVACRGFIQREDCLRAFRTVAPCLVESERVPDLFREVDLNEDGRVSYRDFEIMMRHDTQKDFCRAKTVHIIYENLTVPLTC